jgi:integrase
MFHILMEPSDAAISTTAIGLNELAYNVAKLVQASVRDARQHEPYSVEESKRLLVHADEHRLHALWVLLVMLDVRRGEALVVRWADVDLNAGTVAILGSLQRVGNQVQRSRPILAAPSGCSEH